MQVSNHGDCRAQGLHDFSCCLQGSTQNSVSQQPTTRIELRSCHIPECSNFGYVSCDCCFQMLINLLPQQLIRTFITNLPPFYHLTYIYLTLTQFTPTNDPTFVDPIRSVMTPTNPSRWILGIQPHHGAIRDSHVLVPREFGVAGSLWSGKKHRSSY